MFIKNKKTEKMNTDEKQSSTEKHGDNLEMLEYRPILEDIGNITFKDSNIMQCIPEGHENKSKDKLQECKLVTNDYLKNLNDFSIQALKTLKDFRSYVTSAVHNSNLSISKTALNLKSVIVKSELFDNLMNTRKYCRMINSEEGGKGPWVGTDNEEEAKKLILKLSENRKTFLRKPPDGVFEFNLDENLPVAKLLLKEDPRLQKMRFELVPKSIKEDHFWRNYFYRIRLIKQSFNINHSKYKFECAKPKRYISLENRQVLEKKTNTEIQERMHKGSSLNIEKDLTRKTQNDSCNNVILENEIQEFDSSLYLIDASEEIEDIYLEKEIEQMLKESEEYD